MHGPGAVFPVACRACLQRQQFTDANHCAGANSSFTFSTAAAPASGSFPAMASIFQQPSQPSSGIFGKPLNFFALWDVPVGPCLAGTCSCPVTRPDGHCCLDSRL